MLWPYLVLFVNGHCNFTAFSQDVTISLTTELQTNNTRRALSNEDSWPLSSPCNMLLIHAISSFAYAVLHFNNLVTASYPYGKFNSFDMKYPHTLCRNCITSQGRLKIKMPYYQYSHLKAKTGSRTPYLWNGNSILGKTVFILQRGPGPCITNVIATCRKNLSQWERAFLWKLRCHWLKFLRRVAKTLVIQGPGPSLLSSNRWASSVHEGLTGETSAVDDIAFIVVRDGFPDTPKYRPQIRADDGRNNTLSTAKAAGYYSHQKHGVIDTDINIIIININII